jgi:hypothetical protein
VQEDDEFGETILTVPPTWVSPLTLSRELFFQRYPETVKEEGVLKEEE